MDVGLEKVKNRDDTIDIMKGIAIFLVIIGHAIQYTLMAQNSNFYEDEVFKIIYTFHMPLFMFISGYLIFYSTQKRNVSEIVKSKILNIFVPYVLWTLIDVCISIAVTFVKSKQLSVLFLSKVIINMLIINPGIWFLFTLFILSILLLLQIKLESRLGINIYLISFALILIIPSSQFFDVYFIKWFYLFFIAGYLINKYDLKNISLFNSQNQKKISFIIILITYLCLSFFWCENDYIYVNKFGSLKEGIRIIYRYFVGFLGITIIWQISEFINSKAVNLRRILKYLGKYTLDIYLLQRYIIEKGYEIIAVHIIKGILFTKLLFVLIVTLITFTTLILCIFISNRLLRSNRILNKIVLGYRR